MTNEQRNAFFALWATSRVFLELESKGPQTAIHEARAQLRAAVVKAGEVMEGILPGKTSPIEGTADSSGTLEVKVDGILCPITVPSVETLELFPDQHPLFMKHRGLRADLGRHFDGGGGPIRFVPATEGDGG